MTNIRITYKAPFNLIFQHLSCNEYLNGKICLAIEYTADNSTHMEIKSSDCSEEILVMCHLNVTKALATTAPTIPPTFPCIGSNQGVTNKSKREVESVIQRRHDKPKDVKGNE